LIEVRLFGELRRYTCDPKSPSGAVVYLSANGANTVAQVLAQLGIEPQEVSNIFVNGRLLPRSAYPITLGYPLAATTPLTTEGTLGTSVRAGDRLGIFPTNMGVFVV
jgi:hypothetical protein